MGRRRRPRTLDLTMYARIREEGLRHSHVMEFAGASGGWDIGPRLTGSPNMARANAYTRDMLTAVGLGAMRTLRTGASLGWGGSRSTRGAAWLTPDPEPLWLYGCAVVAGDHEWRPAGRGEG